MKLVNNLDFNTYEAQNMKLQNLASAPASPFKGQVYFDTTLNQARIWNGTAWKATDATGTVTGVTASAPLSSSGGTTPNISISAATGSAAGSMSAADKAKLDTVASGATANATDASLRDRSTHTGSQAISTVTGLQTALDNKLDDSQLGAANGVASLDAGGKVPSNQLPALALTDVNVVADNAARDALVVQEGDVAIVGGTNSYIYDGTTWQTLPSPIDGVTAVLPGSGITSSGGSTPTIAIGADAVTSAHIGPAAVGTSELSSAVAGNGLTGGSGSALAVGSGTGISVTADAIAIDTSVVVRKVAFNVGDGVATSIVCQHLLGTRDVQVTLYTNSGVYDEVMPTVEHGPTVDQVTLRFGAAPAANAYRVVIQG